MGTKLAIFGDWTLVKPKSGGTFTRSPDDQELLPGAREKLEQMRSEGWCLVIASNQGGCAKFEVAAKDLKPGMALYHGGMSRKICDVSGKGAMDQPRLATLSDGDILSFYAQEKVVVSYKTIEDAIEEMRFVLQLTGIEVGFFCPDMEGEELYMAFSDQLAGKAYRSRNLRGKYRKPNPGMLLEISRWACISDKSQRLMVGDRPEDQQAAEAAGFEFEWAKDFFGGGK